MASTLRFLDRSVLIERPPRQPIHVARYGRREQHGLAFAGEGVEDPADVGREPHVEHPVRFVQHQHLELGAVDVSPTHVVEQPPRSGDDDIDAAPQRARLGLHADTAVDGHRLHAQVTPVRSGAFQHLLRQLAGGHQDECPELPGSARLETLQDRQQKRRRLAGTGLRRAHEITPLEAQRDRLPLDGSRFCVALLLDRPQQRGC
jgi:hypothetical protein